MELDTTPEATMSSVIADTSSYNTDKNGSSNGFEMPDTLKSNHDADVIRIIGQHLVDMGLKQTVDLLLEESGIKELNHPLVTKFQQHLLAGEWDKACSLIDELANYSKGDKKTNVNEMKLMIAEQKFLEFIEDNQHVKALKCLRLELTPLISDVKRVQNLTRLLMCKSIEEVRLRANWQGKNLQSRRSLIEKYQRFISPLMMLPSRRLATLMSQAIQLQQEKCCLHLKSNSEKDYVDLKSDHKCGMDKFPLHTIQQLDGHKSEIWYCKFSNDGTKLATGGIAGKVIIWDLDPSTRELSEGFSFSCSGYSVSCLSWSPNDVYILACGSEDQPDLCVWNVVEERAINSIYVSGDECTTTCSWHSSGELFAAAGVKGIFHIYDLEGNRKGSREGLRVQCLSFLYKDPTIILAADNLNRIKSYAIRDMSLQSDEEDILEERHPIMSFTIDREDHYIAVNLLEQGVHLWDYKTKILLRIFSGVSQRYFTIHSSFSSPDSTFLASGSEDGKVYIYHVHKDQPVAILHGHSRCVNCVSWNPKYPELIASVSDDRIIRLWGPTLKDTTKGDT